jgi:Glycogen recognition site of AMP-activated protein kinase
VIVVDAEPGGHRFRFIVDGESRTSPDYRLATDHQNIVVNYLDHVKREAPSEATTDYEPYQFSGRISLYRLV